MTSARSTPRVTRRVLLVLGAVVVAAAGAGAAWWTFSDDAEWVRANAALDAVDGVEGIDRVGASLDDAVIVMDASATTEQISAALVAGGNDERQPPVRVGGVEAATTSGTGADTRALTDDERGSIAATLDQLRNVPLDGVEVTDDSVAVTVPPDRAIEAATVIVDALADSDDVKNVTVEVPGADGTESARSDLRLDEVDSAATLDVLEKAGELRRWNPGVTISDVEGVGAATAFDGRVSLTAADFADAVEGLDAATPMFDSAVQLVAVVPDAAQGQVAEIYLEPMPSGRCAATVRRVGSADLTSEANSCVAALVLAKQTTAEPASP